ncbi:hypothetical protein LTS15_011291 [Exophiala xenobiotica]|nr:hypothetical protein LTS15_011291 [Exophiala xenobiotica]
MLQRATLVFGVRSENEHTQCHGGEKVSLKHPENFLELSAPGIFFVLVVKGDGFVTKRLNGLVTLNSESLSDNLVLLV